MKTAYLILAIVSGLLLFSTFVCGLWIRYSGQADESSTGFHMTIGIATAVAVAATVVLGFLKG